MVNSETMHGYLLAKHIGDRLSQYGFKVDCEVGEDWGWYVSLENAGYSLWYGVASYDRSNDFMVQIHPDKPVIRKWFKKIDVSEKVTKLQDAIFAILQEAASDGSQPVWVG